MRCGNQRDVMEGYSRALRDEMRMNASRFHHCVGELRMVIWGLTDAEFFGSPDWDWQWPSYPPLDVVTIALDADGGCERHLDPESARTVREAYDLLGDWPPPLAGWPQRFDGSGLHFLKFMLGEIDAFESRAHQKLAAAEESVTRSVGP